MHLALKLQLHYLLKFEILISAVYNNTMSKLLKQLLRMFLKHEVGCIFCT